MTDARDGGGSYDKLPVVLIDVKYGKSKLSEAQRAIQAGTCCGSNPITAASNCHMQTLASENWWTCKSVLVSPQKAPLTVIEVVQFSGIS